MAASGAVEVASTQGSVAVGSPLQVLLAAAGAALRIGQGGVEVSAPGSVRFRAGMKEFTGPAAVSAPSPYLAAPPEVHLNPEEPYSVRFAVQGADELPSRCLS
ncbi:DUF2345 domain-containing protein [Azohydromonas caseinilytica]|uniref:DUF2345 domain-containing protein n=1 Tax=Azohydromonas caseinilytica TaxID=2728836 RepID=UPI0035C06A36